MTKEELFAPIREKYNELKNAIEGTDIDKIRELTLEVHAMVHPAEISGRIEKTIADYVLDYMLNGNQNALVPREDYDVDLHYAGTRTVPMCWQFWHTYRIEDLVSNILMADQEQIKSMVPYERVMRILEEGGVTTDFRSVWLLVYWGSLTMGGMILTPMTDHHMMHLPPCLNNLPILEE